MNVPFTLQSFLYNIPRYVSDILIPTLVTIAFLIAIFNIIRYFVIESGNEGAREKARSHALYSVAAFVIIIIFWGIVMLLVDSINLDGARPPCPDYARQAGLCRE